MYQVIPRRSLPFLLGFWLGIWQRDLPNSAIEFRVTANGRVVHRAVLTNAAWGKRGTPARNRVWTWWERASDLQPGTEHIGELLVGGVVQATGIARTLPNSLPGTGGANRPFNVFVGSCYYRPNDPERKVPEAFMELWNHAELRPDVKFLCGDQIYFDNPPGDFARVSLTNPHAWVRRRFTNKYRKTWHTLDALLSRGATYFLTDDHEYFNDYPNRQNAPWVFLTHRVDDYLQRKAEQFAATFQGAGVAEGTMISNDLAFMVLDTRRFRDLGAKTFAQQAAVDRTIKWLKDLRVPGVLVLSSPIFVPRTENSSFGWADVTGRVITDHNLPFFEAQFLPLAHALLEAQVDVVVVAGDPHFSRVAECHVPGHQANNNRPHKIVEVISSAMATVDGAEGNPRRGPDFFPMPAQRHPLIPSSRVQYLNFSSRRQDNNAAKDNFVTLSFTKPDRLKNQVEMQVWSWLCKRRRASHPPVPVDFHRVIQLNGVPPQFLRLPNIIDLELTP